MSAKAVSEASGKAILNKHLSTANKCRFAVINEETNVDKLLIENPWLKETKLVVKPDQLIKRRGKLGLIEVNVDIARVLEWTKQKSAEVTQVGRATGTLRRFIVEPFLPHGEEDEAYICIYSHRSGDTILFTPQGGVDVGDVEAKAIRCDVPVGDSLSAERVEKILLRGLADAKKGALIKFVVDLYKMYQDLYFTYLEINPLVVTPQGEIHILDLAAKLDATAEYLCKGKWGEIDFPPPFGRDAYPEEAYIAELDSKTGASLKLTILNPKGRIWTMVAGGGASVIYSDTICDLGGATELANYGEYSGAPNDQQTYDYAKTILSLMTRERHAQGKVLIIGGGIANFTNVATTFKGIVRALREYQDALIDNNVQVFVRRAGPNFQEGLRIMRELGRSLGIPMYVFGPETHMTAIVGMALGKRPIVEPVESEQHTANFLLPGGSPSKPSNKKVSVTSASAPMAAGAQGESTPSSKSESLVVASPSFKPSAIIQSLQRVEALSPVPPSSRSPFSFKSVQPTAAMSREGSQSKDPVLFTPETKAVIWGMQNRAVQGMLDFDFVCSRKNPSVCAMVYPFTGDHKQKFYWGHTEILIPVYKSMADCFSKHPDASVMVSFASLRSAFESTVEAMSYPQIKTIAIIAEGIPENQTRLLIKQADDKGVTIIGPATVGGIKPGAFKIGNTGGMMDNILSSKLYRPGSVAYVSRSGGMSNELNNIISRHTDGVVEGIAIGGDRYPGTTFMDHLLRYQHNRKVKMLVLLGEVGGDEELRVAEALKNGTLSKPLVGWCIGTCAGMFTTDVQFGHAGASANAECETSTYKNKALKDAGAYVPESFDSLGDVIEEVFRKICPEGIPQDETPPPTVPMDYAWARELGLIRRPASFMTTICDERGQELLYAGIPITDVFKDELGIGGVISLLWFQRRLPPYAFKFFEMSLMLTADHGPAVSGAHNTIVCARAGKDLVSSLVSGLLTIGDRFGGALDGAARQFSSGFDAGLSPNDFVNEMRKKGELIMGIGHRVKSINNPDMRVTILKEYVQKEFPATPMLNYALEVEKITTRKKPNLILNVDGVIATCFVDLLRSSGAFTRQEAEEYIKIGTINGLFVLGRSMGFIGHYLDQRRLKQGLYRHPWDDISYVMPEQYQMNQ